MEQSKLKELKALANNVRIGIIEGVYNAGSGQGKKLYYGRLSR